MQNTIKETFEPNKKQKEAIDITEGPVMLLAGPGTGKTYTLTKRVEKMLSKGIEPENILCLTFSDAASNEMKTRLIEKIGMNASGVNVSTYHSFCMDIIKQNPGDFELIDGFQMADDITKQALLKECIDEYSKNNKIEFLKDKWGNKYFYIQSIISAIETLKRERTTNLRENEQFSCSGTSICRTKTSTRNFAGSLLDFTPKAGGSGAYVRTSSR